MNFSQRTSPLKATSPFLLVLTMVLFGNSSNGEDEIDFGQNSAGELIAHVEFDEPLPLPRSVFPGITGYATGEVGFHSTFFDDPANDFFQLSLAADFRFILLAKDPGMEVWNDHGSAYMTNGESFYVGPPIFDTHPVWNIVSATTGNVYSLTLKLHDLNGVYADSDPVTISFIPIAPALLSIRDNGDNTISLTLLGTPGAKYLVQAATNLFGPSSWTNVSTNIAASDGTATYAEAKTRLDQRFYRSINN